MLDSAHQTVEFSKGQLSAVQLTRQGTALAKGKALPRQGTALAKRERLSGAATHQGQTTLVGRQPVRGSEERPVLLPDFGRGGGALGLVQPCSHCPPPPPLTSPLSSYPTPTLLSCENMLSVVRMEICNVSEGGSMELKRRNNLHS